MAQQFHTWLGERAAGVWLHPSCLPSNQGIGTLGQSAYYFIDFLASIGAKYWQLCPMGPTGFGDSPYQCFSAFAGNPYFVDFTVLVDHYLLKDDELTELRNLPRDYVDYGKLYELFGQIMATAYRRYLDEPVIFEGYQSFDRFKQEQGYWLDSYVAFRALKNHFLGKSWLEWPDDYRHYGKVKNSPLLEENSFLSGIHQFAQYLFWNQWRQLKSYANSKNIQIIGDVPLFVASDSADVWASPEFFEVDKNGLPTDVAGVPPDYFSESGQLWGNPLFNWDKLRQTGYRWWIDRLHVNFKLYDVIRIDHFRGFDSYWAVPFGNENAVIGEWLPGPGMDFFKALSTHFSGQLKLIAEDLGDLTQSAHDLRDATGIPGMAILQFAFGGGDKNPHLPHFHKANQIVYPGSHDNNTSIGWYKEATEKERDHVRRYLKVSGDDINWDLIRTAYQSKANLAIVTFPDILGLGSEGRMNRPGVAYNNWQWRFTKNQLNNVWQERGEYLLSLAKENKR